MPSTFYGLTIAGSALNTFQVAVNTTANNISNIQTKGYTKQVANRQAGEALRVYQKFGTTGSGVVTTSVTSVRNAYYDMKYWENQPAVGHYETKLNYLNQIENYFIDDSKDNPGFSTLFSSMFNQLNPLTGTGGTENQRKAFISSAQMFTSYFKDVSTGLNRLQKDCNDEIRAYVDSINSGAEKIAALNKQINIIELEGGRANELRDQRALIIDELSKIVPITVEETPVTNSNDPDTYLGGTNYIVKIDGQTLVSTYDYRTLSCVSREHRVNQTDADGLYDIKWSDTGMGFNVYSDSMDGTLKALFDLRDGNNAENFRGKVTGVSVSAVTISPETMDSVEAMTMAAEGVITIRNKEYKYTGFTAELDADGKVASYTFQLEDNLDAAEISGLQGKNAAIGRSIDVMGIPYYMAQMSEFVRAFSSRFNAYQHQGVDLNGDPMGSFFIANKFDGTEYDFSEQTVNTDGVTDGANSTITSTSNTYYQLTALNFAVADASVRDSNIFATATDVEGDKVDRHDLVDLMLKLENKVNLFRGGTAEGFLQCIYSDISIDTEESENFLESFSEIASTITNQRLSISGVDEDEEALDLLKFQNAYNLAARMVQCMTEMYDKLINQTGV